jgi:hypothetical protein
MEEKNCEILFEYLRDIIYDSENAKLDLECLDESFHKLGMGLQYLDKAMKEMKHYSAEISKGNLSIEAPGRDNFLCEEYPCESEPSHLAGKAGGERRLFSERFLYGRILRSI